MSPRGVRRLLAATTGLTLVVGVSVAGLRTLNASEPVTVEEAVERFRDQRSPSAAPIVTAAPAPTRTATNAPTTPARTAPGSTNRPTTRTSVSATGKPSPTPSDRRPPEGVYVYATTGHEQLDAGMTSRHDYPDETTITVRHGPGCGLVGRWDAMRDRWDETHECVTAGHSVITKYVSYHRFFGQEERKELTCDDRAYLRPPSTEPGYSWTFVCQGSGTTARTTGEVIGVERTEYGRALHVRATTTLAGSSRGDERRDYWLALDFAGMVRAQVRVDATEDTPFGSVRYHEQYEIRLTSRTPRR